MNKNYERHNKLISIRKHRTKRLNKSKSVTKKSFLSENVQPTGYTMTLSLSDTHIYIHISMLIYLLSRYHRITNYQRNPLDRFRIYQPRTKQISLSSFPISKHVIHTHNIDKVTFNYEIDLRAKPTY